LPPNHFDLLHKEQTSASESLLQKIFEKQIDFSDYKQPRGDGQRLYRYSCDRTNFGRAVLEPTAAGVNFRGISARHASEINIPYADYCQQMAGAGIDSRRDSQWPMHP
jgi:hypothetical protein